MSPRCPLWPRRPAGRWWPPTTWVWPTQWCVPEGRGGGLVRWKQESRGQSSSCCRETAVDPSLWRREEDTYWPGWSVMDLWRSVDRWGGGRRIGGGYPWLQEGAYDIYTEVAKYIGWINKTILSNGGMNSCGYRLAATSTVQLLAAPSTTTTKTTTIPTTTNTSTATTGKKKVLARERVTIPS